MENSMTFTCSMDNHYSNHVYPRSSDPCTRKWLDVIESNQDDGTFVVNVGKSPIKGFVPTAANYNTATGAFNTMQALSNVRSMRGSVTPGVDEGVLKSFRNPFDTSLSLEREYSFNFLRKDYFNIITSSNMGHFYNKLSRNLINESVYQKIGFNAKQEIYTNYHDIKYFNVPTPLSEMFFKTTFDQGQLLNSLITVNPSPNFNYAFGYTGMRSLGKYIHSRSNNTNFRASFLIKSKSENYNAKIHLNNQRILIRKMVA